MPSNIEQKIKELADEMAEEFSTLDDAQDAVMERVDMLREVTYYSDAKELVLNFSTEAEYAAFDELKSLDMMEGIDCLDDLYTKLAWAYCYQSLYKALEEAFTDKEEGNEGEEVNEIANEIVKDIKKEYNVAMTDTEREGVVSSYVENNERYQKLNEIKQDIVISIILEN